MDYSDACLDPLVDELPSRLYPTFLWHELRTPTQAWLMCFGKHTLRRAAENAHPDRVPDHSQRHGLDSYYNFFERSAWTPKGLAHRVGVLIFTRLQFRGIITLLVDDTLAHKRGKSVWGLGWFRDAVASTKKRVATASGHNWVVLAVARLRRPARRVPSWRFAVDWPACTSRAPDKSVVPTLTPRCSRRCWAGGPTNVLPWWAMVLTPPRFAGEPGRTRDVCGTTTWRRGGAYDPRVPAAHKRPTGSPSEKGRVCPSRRRPRPKRIGNGRRRGTGSGQDVEVTVYGCVRSLRAFAYGGSVAHGAGYRAVQVVVGRDPSGRMRDCYLFTTDRQASLSWVITQFAWRRSIEVTVPRQ